jgi:hypothetical protein
VSAPTFTTVSLGDGVDAALARLPTAAGVGQILAEGGRNLVIGRASNLRRWAADHLGRARPRKAAPGKLPPRPPVDLAPIATAIAYATTATAFGQRLLYERLMARHVPLAKRRDLKRPAYLHLRLDARFPRLTVEPAGGADAYGPFRDSRAAARARDALHKGFRLRPCDFEFEPAADLALGLSCIHAQVESCAAPCLTRTSGEDYRALAAGVARLLGGEGDRPPEVPSWVGPAGGRSLIVERVGGGLEIHPVAGGIVGGPPLAATGDALEAALAGLAWPAAEDGGDDTPWLNAWRHARRTGIELRVAEGETPAALAARIRAAFGITPPPS